MWAVRSRNPIPPPSSSPPTGIIHFEVADDATVSDSATEVVGVGVAHMRVTGMKRDKNAPGMGWQLGMVLVVVSLAIEGPGRL